MISIMPFVLYGHRPSGRRLFFSAGTVIFVNTTANENISEASIFCETEAVRGGKMMTC